MAPKTKKETVAAVVVIDDDDHKDEEAVVTKPKKATGKAKAAVASTPAPEVAQTSTTTTEPVTIVLDSAPKSMQPDAVTSPGDVMIKNITIKDLPHLFDHLEALGREMLNPALTDSVKSLREYLINGKPMELQRSQSSHHHQTQYKQQQNQQQQRTDVVTPRVYQGSTNDYRGGRGRGGGFRGRGFDHSRGGYRGRGGESQPTPAYVDDPVD